MSGTGPIPFLILNQTIFIRSKSYFLKIAVTEIPWFFKQSTLLSISHCIYLQWGPFPSLISFLSFSAFHASASGASLTRVFPAFGAALP